MRTFTKPIRPIANRDPIKASHMANHARAIEELQRAIQPPLNKASRKGRSGKRHYNVKLITSGTEGNPIYKVTVTRRMPVQGSGFEAGKVDSNGHLYAHASQDSLCLR